MEAHRKLVLRRLSLLLDAALILAAMLLAYWLHGLLRPRLGFLKVAPSLREYVTFVYLALPVWLLLILVFELDRTFERISSWTQTLLGLIKLDVAGLVALAVLLFLTQITLNRSIVVLFVATSSVLLFAERVASNSWLRLQQRTGQGQTRLLLVGEGGPAMRAFLQSAALDPLPPFVVGYLGPAAAPSGGPSSDLPPALGSLADLERVLHEQAVDHVLFLPPYDEPLRVREAVRVADMLGVPASFAVKRMNEGAVPRVLSMYGQPFINFQPGEKPLAALAVKHALDVLIAALAVVLLAPVFVAVALAIWASMGRPILFAQERAGLYGRRFRMFKFRTMKEGAEQQRDELAGLNEMDGPVFKITDDPRVTPLGRILRRWSLDELPQLFCVLAGTMSLVGPRPLPVREQQEIRGWHRRRLSMKPGITGLWQVSGRSDLGFEEWMKLDLRYVDEWSLWLDALILLKTIPAVLLGRGAR